MQTCRLGQYAYILELSFGETNLLLRCDDRRLFHEWLQAMPQ